MTRMILTAEELHQMVQKEAKKYPGECGDIVLGEVQWHEPDDDGCNWTISHFRGRDVQGCLGRINAFATRLRSQYNVPDPSTEFDHRGWHVKVAAAPQKQEGHEHHVFVATYTMVKGGARITNVAGPGAYPNSGEALLAGEASARKEIDQQDAGGRPR